MDPNAWHGCSRVRWCSGGVVTIMQQYSYCATVVVGSGAMLFEWVLVDSNGPRWISMDPNGFQGISMHANGFLSMSITAPVPTIAAMPPLHQ